MTRALAAQRGFSLLIAMIVVVLMTMLVVGAIAFTGNERSAAVVHTRAQALEGCAQAARNLFLSRVRVLRGNARDIVLDTQLGTKLTVRSQHYDGTVALGTVTRIPDNQVAGSAAHVQDLSNRVGSSPLLAGYYQVTALCQDGASGPQHEVEFVTRIGL